MQSRSKSVDLIIDQNGNVTIDAIGFTDGGCHEATKSLEAALGIEINRTGKTPVRQAVQRERGKNLN